MRTQTLKSEITAGASVGLRRSPREMKSILIVLILFMTLSAFGQNVFGLNEWVADPVKLKKVYDRYVKSEFAEVAHELAKRAGENPVLQGYISKEKLAEPWTHSMALTLSKAWSFHADYAARKEPRGEKFEILMQVLEDPKVGPGRHSALQEITTRLDWGENWGNNDPSLPSIEIIVERLHPLALDPKGSLLLRLYVIGLLTRYDDPNSYLDLAIDLASTKKHAGDMAQAIMWAMNVTSARDKLTRENKAKYLNCLFKILQEIDDGESGRGYFLAMHLGHVASVEPIVNGESPFNPNQKLPRYDSSKGGSMQPYYFQDTVDNALNWWSQNMNKYGEQDADDQLPARPDSDAK